MPASACSTSAPRSLMSLTSATPLHHGRPTSIHAHHTTAFQARVHQASVYFQDHDEHHLQCWSDRDQHPGYYGNFKVWLNERGVANLLSIPELEEHGYKVETHTDRDWVVTSPQGKRTIFKRDTGVCKGMPYIDLREHGEEGIAMISTVRERFDGHTQKEVKKAILSRVVRRQIGHPSEKHFESIVSEKNAPNFDSPVTVADVRRAKVIFGQEREGLRGYSVRKAPKRVKVELVEIPRDFYKLHKFVTLTADVMFVCGIPFLVTRSRGIKFYTGEFIPNRKAGQLAKSLRKVLYLYAKGGFLVNCCLMDREFEAVKEHLPLVEINTTAAREHVPEIESGIRRIKEKTRCFSSEWLFLFIPTLLLIHTVYTAIYCLNSFMIGSDNYGLAPRTIVTRIPANFERDFKAAPGDYVEAEMDRIITNTNEPRTHPCLYVPWT